MACVGNGLWVVPEESFSKMFHGVWFDPLFLYSGFTCQIPGFCMGGTSIPGIENKVNCDVIVGYKSVYRMCFAMACFFFLFSIIMIRVRSSKDPRGPIQNGFVPQLQHHSCESWVNAALWWPNAQTERLMLCLYWQKNMFFTFCCQFLVLQVPAAGWYNCGSFLHSWCPI